MLSNEIILGVTPNNKQFFDNQFPGLKKIDLPSYNIRYSKWLPVWLKLIFQWPFIQRVILKENKLLKCLIKEKQINVVISDSRFGLHNNKIHSVFITHQLTIQSPVLKKLANKINLRHLKMFHEIWVPDYESPLQRLSGELSSFSNLNVKFINPKSLLADYNSLHKTQHVDYLILLSGVEPQRKVLEKLLLNYFESTAFKVVLVRGTDTPIDFHPKNIEVFNIIHGQELAQLILNSTNIICRSGYSTLMDIHTLGKNNLTLVPTPGQTEQEYLAKYWEMKFNAKVVLQTELKNNWTKLLD